MAEIISFTENNLSKIVDRFKDGNLVAFPSDTIYGLGVSIKDSNAIRKLYQIKQRKEDKPSQLLIGDKDKLKNYVLQVSSSAELLMRKFWPGPLTLIFYASLEVPHYICKDGKVAVRFPKYELLNETIKKLGHAVVASSCNFADERPPISIDTISSELLSKIDMVIDGKVVSGKESTIIDVTKTRIKVLREGAISREQL